MKTRIILLMAALLTLAGCERIVTPEQVIRTEYREYKILGIDPPKHFSVDLLDVKTHQLFKNEGRRKHCTGWQKWRVNQKVKVQTQYFKKENDHRTYIRLVGADRIFCN